MRTLLDGATRRQFLLGSATAALGLLRSNRSLAALARQGAARHVVIVGGGLAGLSAAFELQRAGHRVTVLEARSRPGGRVYTLRDPFSDGLHAEAGAGRIPNTHQWTLHYAKLFGLELRPFLPPRGDRLFWVGGARLRVRPNEEVDLHKIPLALTDKERQLGLGGMVEEYLLRPARGMADPRSPGWPAKDLADVDRLTSAEFLRSRGASQAATELLLLPFELAEADGTSALWVLRDMLLSESHVTLSKIRGGNDRLPHALASRLGKDIRYGRAVSRIEQAEKSVRAICTTRSGVETVEGDALVCAIPFSVLRRVQVSPPWPKDKDDAIRELRYDPTTRVYLQLADRRWEAKGLNGFAVTDFPDEIWHPTHDQPGRSGILMSYGCGTRARAFGERDAAERIKVTRERFEQAFEGLAPTERHHSFVWDDEEWNRGAISLHAPGQLTRFADVAGRREGRVWFAGEHLSAWPGWMQGALDSGNRVADEINRISADQLAAAVR